MALNATAGSASADSYVTLTEANAYFDARFGSDAWTALATDALKEKALKQATRHIDRFRFWGTKGDAAQALQFPRGDPPVTATVAVVPQSVKDAQCEEALAVAANSTTGGRPRRQLLQAEGVTGFAVGDMREEFGDGAKPLPGAPLLCPEARALLARWIDRTGRMHVAGRQEPIRDAWGRT